MANAGNFGMKSERKEMLKLGIYSNWAEDALKYCIKYFTPVARDSGLHPKYVKRLQDGELYYDMDMFWTNKDSTEQKRMCIVRKRLACAVKIASMIYKIADKSDYFECLVDDDELQIKKLDVNGPMLSLLADLIEGKKKIDRSSKLAESVIDWPRNPFIISTLDQLTKLKKQAEKETEEKMDKLEKSYREQKAAIDKDLDCRLKELDSQMEKVKRTGTL